MIVSAMFWEKQLPGPGLNDKPLIIAKTDKVWRWIGLIGAILLAMLLVFMQLKK